MIVSAGCVYGFGSFGEDLSSHLELSTYGLSHIALCGNVGLWVGSFSGGIVADARGPRTAMVGGALLFAVGNGGMFWVLDSGITARTHPWVTYLGAPLPPSLCRPCA